MSKAYLAGGLPDLRRNSQEQFAVEEPQAWRVAGKMAAATLLPVLLAMVIAFFPSRAMASSNAGAQVSVGISVNFGPPPIPVYAQPMCPGPSYIWTPGYWAWDPSYGYYWVPGTWVLAPFPGALWTPGYWGWSPTRAVFLWHAGYWGPRVGFYGGINYGFGYFGVGYVGGYWRGDRFFYNREVNRINLYTVHNYYTRTVIIRNVNRVSYNGGRGGIDARPSRDDYLAERERRMGEINSQIDHERMARETPAMRWSENHGRPDIAATPRPGMFRGNGISRATRPGGPYTPGRAQGPARPGFQRFGQQPGGRPQGRPQGRQPQYQYRGAPEPGRYQNQRPMQRNQGQPQYRGPQGRQPQRGSQGRGNQNRQDNSRGRGRGQGGPGRR